LQILSFVFEQGLVTDPRKQFPDIFWMTGRKALSDLSHEESRIFKRPIRPLIPPPKKSASYLEIFSNSLQPEMTADFHPELFWVFLVHCQLLPYLSVQDRARRHEPNHPELQTLLVQSFLPKVFIALEDFLAQYDADFDVDGNIFGSLLRYLLLQRDISPKEVVGPGIFAKSGSTIYSFSALSPRFPPPLSSTAHFAIHPPIRLLPFEHAVFDEQLSLVKVPLDDDDDKLSFGELEFGKDTVFHDRHHWHNHKRLILPKHLGGDDPRPTDAWQRQKMLKRNQRFIAKLGHDAATLTGALGAKFDRITITPVGNKQKEKSRAPPSQIVSI
jgi:ATP-dependent RNA helicase DDX60